MASEPTRTGKRWRSRSEKSTVSKPSTRILSRLRMPDSVSDNSALMPPVKDVSSTRRTKWKIASNSEKGQSAPTPEQGMHSPGKLDSGKRPGRSKCRSGTLQNTEIVTEDSGECQISKSPAKCAALMVEMTAEEYKSTEIRTESAATRMVRGRNKHTAHTQSCASSRKDTLESLDSAPCPQDVLTTSLNPQDVLITSLNSQDALTSISTSRDVLADSVSPQDPCCVFRPNPRHRQASSVPTLLSGTIPASTFARKNGPSVRKAAVSATGTISVGRQVQGKSPKHTKESGAGNGVVTRRHEIETSSHKAGTASSCVNTGRPKMDLVSHEIDIAQIRSVQPVSKLDIPSLADVKRGKVAKTRFRNAIQPHRMTLVVLEKFQYSALNIPVDVSSLPQKKWTPTHGQLRSADETSDYGSDSTPLLSDVHFGVPSEGKQAEPLSSSEFDTFSSLDYPVSSGDSKRVSSMESEDECCLLPKISRNGAAHLQLPTSPICSPPQIAEEVDGFGLPRNTVMDVCHSVDSDFACALESSFLNMDSPKNAIIAQEGWENSCMSGVFSLRYPFNLPETANDDVDDSEDIPVPTMKETPQLKTCYSSDLLEKVISDEEVHKMLEGILEKISAAANDRHLDDAESALQISPYHVKETFKTIPLLSAHTESDSPLNRNTTTTGGEHTPSEIIIPAEQLGDFSEDSHEKSSNTVGKTTSTATVVICRKRKYLNISKSRKEKPEWQPTVKRRKLDFSLQTMEPVSKSAEVITAVIVEAENQMGNLKQAVEPCPEAARLIAYTPRMSVKVASAEDGKNIRETGKENPTIVPFPVPYSNPSSSHAGPMSICSSVSSVSLKELLQDETHEAPDAADAQVSEAIKLYAGIDFDVKVNLRRLPNKRVFTLGEELLKRIRKKTWKVKSLNETPEEEQVCQDTASEELTGDPYLVMESAHVDSHSCTDYTLDHVVSPKKKKRNVPSDPVEAVVHDNVQDTLTSPSRSPRKKKSPKKKSPKKKAVDILTDFELAISRTGTDVKLKKKPKKSALRLRRKSSEDSCISEEYKQTENQQTGKSGKAPKHLEDLPRFSGPLKSKIVQKILREKAEQEEAKKREERLEVEDPVSFLETISRSSSKADNQTSKPKNSKPLGKKTEKQKKADDTLNTILGKAEKLKFDRSFRKSPVDTQETVTHSGRNGTESADLPLGNELQFNDVRPGNRLQFGVLARSNSVPDRYSTSRNVDKTAELFPEENEPDLGSREARFWDKLKFPPNSPNSISSGSVPSSKDLHMPKDNCSTVCKKKRSWSGRKTPVPRDDLAPEEERWGGQTNLASPSNVQGRMLQGDSSLSVNPMSKSSLMEAFNDIMQEMQLPLNFDADSDSDDESCPRTRDALSTSSDPSVVAIRSPNIMIFGQGLLGNSFGSRLSSSKTASHVNVDKFRTPEGQSDISGLERSKEHVITCMADSNYNLQNEAGDNLVPGELPNIGSSGLQSPLRGKHVVDLELVRSPRHSASYYSEKDKLLDQNKLTQEKPGSHSKPMDSSAPQDGLPGLESRDINVHNVRWSETREKPAKSLKSIPMMENLRDEVLDYDLEEDSDSDVPGNDLYDRLSSAESEAGDDSDFPENEHMESLDPHEFEAENGAVVPDNDAEDRLDSRQFEEDNGLDMPENYLEDRFDSCKFETEKGLDMPGNDLEDKRDSPKVEAENAPDGPENFLVDRLKLPNHELDGQSDEEGKLQLNETYSDGELSEGPRSPMMSSTINKDHVENKSDDRSALSEQDQQSDVEDRLALDDARSDGELSEKSSSTMMSPTNKNDGVDDKSDDGSDRSGQDQCSGVEDGLVLDDGRSEGELSEESRSRSGSPSRSPSIGEVQGETNLEDVELPDVQTCSTFIRPNSTRRRRPWRQSITHVDDDDDDALSILAPTEASFLHDEDGFDSLSPQKDDGENIDADESGVSTHVNDSTYMEMESDISIATGNRSLHPAPPTVKQETNPNNFSESSMGMGRPRLDLVHSVSHVSGVVQSGSYRPHAVLPHQYPPPIRPPPIPGLMNLDTYCTPEFFNYPGSIPRGFCEKFLQTGKCKRHRQHRCKLMHEKVHKMTGRECALDTLAMLCDRGDMAGAFQTYKCLLLLQMQLPRGRVVVLLHLAALCCTANEKAKVEDIMLVLSSEDLVDLRHVKVFRGDFDLQNCWNVINYCDRNCVGVQPPVYILNHALQAALHTRHRTCLRLAEEWIQRHNVPELVNLDRQLLLDFIRLHRMDGSAQGVAIRRKLEQALLFQKNHHPEVSVPVQEEESLAEPEEPEDLNDTAEAFVRRIRGCSFTNNWIYLGEVFVEHCNIQFGPFFPKIFNTYMHVLKNIEATEGQEQSEVIADSFKTFVKTITSTFKRAKAENPKLKLDKDTLSQMGTELLMLCHECRWWKASIKIIFILRYNSIAWQFKASVMALEACLREKEPGKALMILNESQMIEKGEFWPQNLSEREYKNRNQLLDELFKQLMMQKIFDGVVDVLSAMLAGPQQRPEEVKKTATLCNGMVVTMLSQGHVQLAVKVLELKNKYKQLTFQFETYRALIMECSKHKINVAEYFTVCNRNHYPEQCFTTMPRELSLTVDLMAVEVKLILEDCFHELYRILCNKMLDQEMLPEAEFELKILILAERIHVGSPMPEPYLSYVPRTVREAQEQVLMILDTWMSPPLQVHVISLGHLQVTALSMEHHLKAMDATGRMQGIRIHHPKITRPPTAQRGRAGILRGRGGIPRARGFGPPNFWRGGPR